MQVFRPFAFDALDLCFTQARFNRADDVQGDFVLQSKNIIERVIIFFGPNMNAGFGLDQLGGNTHAGIRIYARSLRGHIERRVRDLPRVTLTD